MSVCVASRCEAESGREVTVAVHAETHRVQRQDRMGATRTAGGGEPSELRGLGSAERSVRAVGRVARGRRQRQGCRSGLRLLAPQRLRATLSGTIWRDPIRNPGEVAAKGGDRSGRRLETG